MWGRRNDIVFPGVRFGRLTIVERMPREMGKHRYMYRVRCKCDCGKEATPEISDLTGGRVVSCGCLKKERIAQISIDRVVPGKGYGKVFPRAVFGRLTVIRRIYKDERPTGKVKCRCECGTVKLIPIDSLVGGGAKSCGCLAREKTAQRNKDTARFNSFSRKFPHTFSSWSSMIGRCYSKQWSGYKGYGSKGVVVCEGLRKSPWNLKEVIGLRKKARPTIDRFPIHNGNYTCGRCPECRRKGWDLNVRWASWSEQMENKGLINIRVTAFGQTLVLSQWSRLSGIGYECLRRRLKRGWSPEELLTTPDKFGNRYDPE